MNKNKAVKIIAFMFILAFVFLIGGNLYIRSQENKAIQAHNHENYQQSIAYYESIMRFKEDPQYIANIAYNHYLLGNYTEANNMISKVIDEIEDRLEASYLYALSYRALGDKNKAVEILNDILIEDATYARGWQLLAEIELARENYYEAINAFRKVANLRPNAGEIYLALARAYKLDGQIEAEIATYEEMLIRGATVFGKTKEESMYIAEYNLGVSLFKLGEIADARDVFLSASQKISANADTWYYLASCAALLDIEGQMYYALQKAIDLDSEYLELVVKDSDFSRFFNTKRFDEFISKYK